MKNILLIVLTVLYFANIKAEVVEGKLLDNLNNTGLISKMILTGQKEEIKLVNEYVEIESCVNGRYEIEEVSDGVFQLKDVVECEQWVDSTKEITACPEFYKPVCGEVLVNEFGAKALPQLITFPNACELYRAKAAFINKGNCK